MYWVGLAGVGVGPASLCVRLLSPKKSHAALTVSCSYKRMGQADGVGLNTLLLTQSGPGRQLQALQGPGL